MAYLRLALKVSAAIHIPGAKETPMVAPEFKAQANTTLLLGWHHIVHNAK